MSLGVFILKSCDKITNHCIVTWMYCIPSVSLTYWTVRSSELVTTAQVMTAQPTARWTRWTTGISRTIPSPDSDITWWPVSGGAKMTRGAGESSPARWWWRRLRRPRSVWSPISSCCSQMYTMWLRPIWRSRGKPCGDTCNSTKSTTHLTCTKKIHPDGNYYNLVNSSGSWSVLRGS